MTKFTPNQPVTTRVPGVVVDGDLPPGEYRFRLVVFDNDGNASAPDDVVVRVRDRRIVPPLVPPVLDPRPPILHPLPIIPPIGGPLPGPLTPGGGLRSLDEPAASDAATNAAAKPTRQRRKRRPES